MLEPHRPPTRGRFDGEMSFDGTTNPFGPTATSQHDDSSLLSDASFDDITFRAKSTNKHAPSSAWGDDKASVKRISHLEAKAQLGFAPPFVLN